MKPCKNQAWQENDGKNHTCKKCAAKKGSEMPSKNMLMPGRLVIRLSVNSRSSLPSHCNYTHNWECIHFYYTFPFQRWFLTAVIDYVRMRCVLSLLFDRDTNWCLTFLFIHSLFFRQPIIIGCVVTVRFQFHQGAKKSQVFAEWHRYKNEWATNLSLKYAAKWNSQQSMVLI